MITKKEFGVTKDKKQAYLYTISGANGMEAAVTDYGAILVNLMVPDAKGEKKDLVLGYDKLADYEENSCFFGATIGRNANRIGGASFQIDGPLRWTVRHIICLPMRTATISTQIFVTDFTKYCGTQKCWKTSRQCDSPI